MTTSSMILAEAGYADYDRNPADIARVMGLKEDGSDWPLDLIEADKVYGDCVGEHANCSTCQTMCEVHALMISGQHSGAALDDLETENATSGTVWHD